MSEATEPSGKENKQVVYSLSEDYWAKQPATVDGMLGGYEFISDIDIEQSQQFLNYFLKSNNKNKIDKQLAIDCGAGIGRITKHLLLKNFENVEMIDVTESFINESKKYLGADDSNRIAKFHVCGLQNFYPEINHYDCIWIQWVLGYLKDNDLIDFFKRCKLALKPDGIIILKENVSISEFEWDEADSSWTRPRQAYLNFIHKAGLVVVREEKQRKFPDDIYEVRFFAFK